ncbi:MAG: flagellar motor protein MotB [Magnetococcales bacterium]|nr:flagellar motor protein MotB [Magnetococcales bacterium]
MAKKKCPECKEGGGAPLWMVTFGDLMALLLTFFVLLLSFAQLEIVKFEQAAGSIKDAFGVQRIQQIDPSPTGEKMITTDFNQEIILVKIKEKLEFILVKMIDNGEAELIESEEGFTVRLGDDNMFTPDSMKIKPEMISVLEQIANQLIDIPNMVHITGHTDNQPANPYSPYPTSWAIGAGRAASVVAFLEKQGIDPARLQARSNGSYAPIESNQTAQGRGRNRRIEVTISRETQPVTVNQFMETPHFIQTNAPDSPG